MKKIISLTAPRESEFSHLNREERAIFNNFFLNTGGEHK